MGELTVGSLFAGIGGFDLGLERAGMVVKWQVEIDPFCRKVLEKHWPKVKRYEDVRTVESANLEPVDLVCGGFPCQPHSLAGRRRGAEDERDLWPEFRRIIRDVRPRWVVAENVPGLLSNDAGRFFGGILRDLAESGYDAEWDCLPAAAVGARHRRDRVWIVAYPQYAERRACAEGQDDSYWHDAGRQEAAGRLTAHGADGRARDVAYANGRRQQKRQEFDGASLQGSTDWRPRREYADGLRDDVADACGNGLEGHLQAGDGERSGARIFTGRAITGGSLQAGAEQWAVEPDVGRVAHGVPARVDRLRGLGNAIVPQIAEWIGRRIIEAEERLRATT